MKFFLITAALFIGICGFVFGQNSGDFEVDVQTRDGSRYGAITGYKGTERNVRIPRRINGVPVIAILDKAFYKSDIRSVSIPDGVSFIGKQAFAYSTLEEITVPFHERWNIFDNAFFCTSLRTIIIDANITLESGKFSLMNIDFLSKGGEPNFVDFYNRNGKKAGEYKLGENGWTYSPR
jgi:hypothetical protein